MNRGDGWMMPGWMPIALAVAVGVTSVGCSGEDEQVDDDDAGTETDVDDDAGDPSDDPFEIDDPYDLVPFQEGVDRQAGHPDIDKGPPGEDEVRVGRIGVEDTGFSGIWSHCRSGDFRMANSEIELCIQEESTNRMEVYTGGKLVDVRRQDQDESDEQTMDLLMPLLIDLHTASAESVEVVRDGTDGVAVLRVSGHDIDIAQMSGVLSSRVHDPIGLDVQTEYRLQPGEKFVEIVTMIAPPSGERTYQVGDWFAYGDRAEAWTPDSGFGAGTSEMPWLAAVGEDGHSYGLVFDQDQMGRPMGIADDFNVPWVEFRTTSLEVADDEPGAYRRWFAIGDGSLDSVRRIAGELRDEPLGDHTASFEVVDEADAPIEGARLVVYDDDRAVTSGQTGPDGTVDLHVAPGSYDIEITEVAGPLVLEDSVEVDDDARLAIPQLAEAHFQVDDHRGEPASARVTFEHPELGSWFEYAIGGTVETVVPADELTVMVTRGMEYDLYREPMHFEPGEIHQVDVELQQGVDTEGWRSGDFHQHLEPSLDSRLHVEARVKENVTQGVELAVPTDHDIVSDLSPTIEQLGVEDEISSFPGVEISPLYAHYNLYPVPYRPDERGRGTIPLAQLEDDRDIHLPMMPEIVETARGFDTDPVVQMNHPRNNSGMMADANFDPEVDPAENDHHRLTLDIDTIEVINRYGDVCQVLADWSGLLNDGRRVTGLGNSDSHDPDAEAGVPRNYMHLDLPPGQLDADPVREVLREGAVSVASHAFIELGGGIVPGDEIEADEQGFVELDVTVETPDFAEADRLFVIVNGSVVETIERVGDGGEFDFEQTIELQLDEDSWVVLWADGDEPTAPIPRSRQVIAFTNPVFVITEGDSWEAPGVRPLDLDAIDTGYCG